MRFLAGVLATLAVLAAIGFGIVWTGAYNAAATDSHEDVVYWALDTTMRNSVENQAADVQAPAEFTDEQARSGFGHYDEMCVLCHGAPGVKRTEWAEGLRPMPPELSQAAPQWNAAEIFWIVRQGIKMSGMPAMGPTHSEEDIWNIVAFVEQLPAISAEEYDRLREELGGAEGGHHGSGAGEEGGGHHEGGTAPEAAGGHESAVGARLTTKRPSGESALTESSAPQD